MNNRFAIGAIVGLVAVAIVLIIFAKVGPIDGLLIGLGLAVVPAILAMLGMMWANNSPGAEIR